MTIFRDLQCKSLTRNHSINCRISRMCYKAVGLISSKQRWRHTFDDETPSLLQTTNWKYRKFLKLVQPSIYELWNATISFYCLFNYPAPKIDSCGARWYHTQMVSLQLTSNLIAFETLFSTFHLFINFHHISTMSTAHIQLHWIQFRIREWEEAVWNEWTRIQVFRQCIFIYSPPIK